jgi:hypothetical protein
MTEGGFCMHLGLRFGSTALFISPWLLTAFNATEYEGTRFFNLRIRVKKELSISGVISHRYGLCPPGRPEGSIIGGQNMEF